jgi:hypothetical protein
MRCPPRSALLKLTLQHYSAGAVDNVNGEKVTNYSAR